MLKKQLVITNSIPASLPRFTGAAQPALFCRNV